MIAEVVVGRIARATDKIYHYSIPESFEQKICFGMRVKIPFGIGDKCETGYVVGFADKSPAKKLKDILELEDAVLSQDMWNLALWMRNKYLCSHIEAVNSVVPPGQGAFGADSKDKIVRGVRLLVSREEALELLEKIRSKAPVQYRIIELLMNNGFVFVPDICKLTGASSSAVSALEKKGIVEYEEREVFRRPVNMDKIKETMDLSPTREQRTVLEKLKQAVEKEEYKSFLLHGVTGSGKTEVFLQTIKQVIKMGKKAIVLVPEIALTPQMVDRFCGRFGNRVAVLHSGLSLGERFDEWKRIKSGEVDVAIGARSAIFAPFENIGLIIIDEEHESSYKSEMAPKYDAREVAKKRAEDNGAVLIMASATPSLESYYGAINGEHVLLEMKDRYNKNSLPQAEVVDMRKELAEGNRSIFSRKLKEELEANIKNKKQSILFLNRRGFASFVSCRSCGYVEECENCKVSLTYHKFEDELTCHYCGFKKKPQIKCPSCGSPHIRHFGIGTERVEQEIKKEIPQATVIRMDADTTGCKMSHEKILEKFATEKTDILLGTQMVSKGLDFKDVTLVGVLAADISLNIDDFRAKERTFDLITQVSGRAGRGEDAGRCIIQTYTPDSDAINFAKQHDYAGFYSSEIEIRKALCYPPFCDIVSLMVVSPTENGALVSGRTLARELREVFEGWDDVIDILGPHPAPITKINNKYRYRILIKCKATDQVRSQISGLLEKHRKSKTEKNIYILADINPFSML